MARRRSMKKADVNEEEDEQEKAHERMTRRKSMKNAAANEGEDEQENIRRRNSEYAFRGIPSAPFREPKYFSSNIPICSPPLDNGWQWAIDNAVEWRVPARVPRSELLKAFNLVAQIRREAVFRFGSVHQFLFKPSLFFACLRDSDKELLQKWTRIPNSQFSTAEDLELMEVVGYFTENNENLDDVAFTRIGAEYHALHANELKKRYSYLKEQDKEPRKWTPEEMMIVRQEFQKDTKDELMYDRMVKRLEGRTHSSCLRKLEFMVHVDEHAGRGQNYYDALQWGNEEVSEGNEPLTNFETNMLVEAVIEYRDNMTGSVAWELIANLMEGKRDPYFLEQIYKALPEKVRTPKEWTSEEDRTLSNSWSLMTEPDYRQLAQALPNRIPATCYKRMQVLIERAQSNI